MQICEAIKDLADVRLVIAGGGPYEKELEAVYGSQGNVEFKGLLSIEESMEWTNKADMIFAFYDPKISINRRASPAKMFDAMMCGTPVLANSESMLVAEIINKEKCGLLVPYEDISAIRQAIEKLKEKSNIRIEMGRNGRRAFEREYNRTEMESRLLRLYDKIFFSEATNLLEKNSG